MVIMMRNENKSPKYEVVRNPHDGRYKVVEFGDHFGTPFADCETEEEARTQGAEFLEVSQDEIW